MFCKYSAGCGQRFPLETFSIRVCWKSNKTEKDLKVQLLAGGIAGQQLHSTVPIHAFISSMAIKIVLSLKRTFILTFKTETHQVTPCHYDSIKGHVAVTTRESNANTPYEMYCVTAFKHKLGLKVFIFYRVVE